MMYSFDISFQIYFCSWTILKLYQYTPAAYYYYYEYITSTLRMLPLPQKLILCKCLTFLPTFSNVKLMHFALESFSYHGTEEGLILNQSLFFFIVFEKKKKLSDCWRSTKYGWWRCPRRYTWCKSTRIFNFTDKCLHDSKCLSSGELS